MTNVAEIRNARMPLQIDTRRYAKCIEVSKRIRWDIDRDVIRGRALDVSRKFLPDGLSKVNTLDFLTDGERRLLSQVQGRTYANIFGLVERYITAKILEVSQEHVLGDQTALEALVRFTDEELKHQELFRRIERLAAGVMGPGYKFTLRPNDVAWAVLGKSTWAVLALTCLIELFTQAHYRESISMDVTVSDLYKDVFLFHWKEESQHAVLDELEWRREDAKLSPEQRDTDGYENVRAQARAAAAGLTLPADDRAERRGKHDADDDSRQIGRIGEVGEFMEDGCSERFPHTVAPAASAVPLRCAISAPYEPPSAPASRAAARAATSSARSACRRGAAARRACTDRQS